jgi:hypothetical protein
METVPWDEVDGLEVIFEVEVGADEMETAELTMIDVLKAVVERLLMIRSMQGRRRVTVDHKSNSKGYPVLYFWEISFT